MYLPPVVRLALAALLFYPLAAQAQNNAPSVLYGSISGTVLFADGRSAGGMMVEVRLSTGPPVAVVYTDRRGDFQFAQLPSGRYTVVVNEPGYEPIQESVEADFVSGQGLTMHLRKANSAPSGSRGDVVSVRELSIPAKAQNAYQKGLERMAKKDPAGSLRHFQRAAAAFPSYYEAFLQLGLAQAQLGEKAEAEKSLHTAIDLSGGNCAEAEFALAALLSDQEQFGDAEKLTRQALILRPASWFGQYVLSRALFGLNRLAEAEQCARKVLSLKRDFAMVHLLLANIHIRNREQRPLLEDLDAYLTLEPKGPYSPQARQMREAVRESLASPESLANVPPRP